MVGSQGQSIQGSIGVVSQGSRGTMNHTSHGKNFGYQMHRKTNSNKLPHIGASNDKDFDAQNT